MTEAVTEPKRVDIPVHAVHLELVDPSSLVPHPRNPNTHSKKQIALLAKIIAHQGWRSAITVSNRSGFVVSGHARLASGLLLGCDVVPIDRQDFDSEASEYAHMIADNQIAEMSEIDVDLMKGLLLELESGTLGDFDMDLTGFDAKALEDYIVPEIGEATGVDAAPATPKNPVSKLGDMWTLGDHRLLCGDSVNAEHVRRLMGEDLATVLHADPPYGMGKEAAGIANDNLYDEKLDAFQMSWWKVWSAHLLENASAYIWGNAPELWRLWWRGGLSAHPDIMFRNEIVWNKGSGFGMRSEGGHSYPPATERCLFFMLGQQFLGNQNIADYWEGYEPLRSWLEAQRDQAGWTNSEVNRITDSFMAGHWFSRSQFIPISSKHYAVLSAAAAGRAFVETYDDLFARLFPEARDGGNEHRRELSAKLRETRTFFDNTHDAMIDVWDFPRVFGDERYGHATPKPVAMIERTIKTSAPAGAIVAEPFLGSGTTLIAAARTGRRCFAMEIAPEYVDVALIRWQKLTGERAIREDGAAFDELAPA